MTEDEVVGWHHQLDGHEFERNLGVGDGQGSLACCSPWGRCSFLLGPGAHKVLFVLSKSLFPQPY